MPELLSTNPNAGLVSTDPSAATPMGSERTRIDTNAIGVDHDKITRWWADIASKHLPEKWAPIGAYIGTLLTDVPASVLEQLSAPENIATMGAGKIPLKAPEAPKLVDAPSMLPSKGDVGRIVETAGKALQHPLKFSGQTVERIGKAMQVETPAAAKPSFDTLAVTRIRELLDQGWTQGEAVRRVMNLKAKGQLR